MSDIKHDNWAERFDTSGNALVPAMPSPDAVIAEVAAGNGPTEATQRAFAADVPAASHGDPAPVPAKRGIDGIMRQDWNKPRNEAGQFISKSANDLRQQWDKEGGYQANVARVQAVEATILGLS